MKKFILLSLLIGVLIFGLFKARGYYYWKKEEKRRATFYENLVDTSSPTVSKDSILIAYQDDVKHFIFMCHQNTPWILHLTYPVIT